MEYKDILILVLVVIILYYNQHNIKKVYKIIKSNFKPYQHYDIKSDLTLVENESKNISKYINDNINENIKDKKLKDILLYSLNDGKKIRPVIILSIYKQLNKQSNKEDDIHISIIYSALSIEYIHSASLILDDIMDDDDYRRGKESIHVKYDLTIAQLTTIVLCSIGLQNLFRSFHELYKLNPDANKNIPLIVGNVLSELLKDLGIGQYLDISSTNHNNFSDLFKKADKTEKLKITVEEIIHKKTSSLFEYCFIIPWIFNNYSKSDSEIEEGIKNMRKLAQKFGLIYQISDDFEDIEKDIDRDCKNSVSNYVVVKGYYNAYKNYNKIVKKFNEVATREDMLTNELKEIITYLSNKVEIYYNNKDMIFL
jgi:geranylgeranyl diphosphate synthase type II